MPKDCLFVTLADSSYLEHAKQLFASLCFSGGWKGDYMLLGHGLNGKEVSWFTGKDILVKLCDPLYEGTLGGYSAVLTSKFYLFTPFFKQWKTVVYCDADVIVKGRLDSLARLSGFHATVDWQDTLAAQIVNESAVLERDAEWSLAAAKLRKLRMTYNLQQRAFCGGFFVFSTDLIDGGIHSKLRRSMEEYHAISSYGDQLAFNLVFYKNWQELCPLYSLQMVGSQNRWGLNPAEIRPYTLHFIGAEKPWHAANEYHAEWQANLSRADQIDLTDVPQGVAIPDEEQEAFSRFVQQQQARMSAQSTPLMRGGAAKA